MTNILNNMTSADEPLIVRSLGYLIVPKAVKHKLGGGSPRHYPNPSASIKVDSEQVHLIYSFPRDTTVPESDGIKLKRRKEE